AVRLGDVVGHPHHAAQRLVWPGVPGERRYVQVGAAVFTGAGQGQDLLHLLLDAPRGVEDDLRCHVSSLRPGDLDRGHEALDTDHVVAERVQTTLVGGLVQQLVRRRDPDLRVTPDDHPPGRPHVFAGRVHGLPGGTGTGVPVAEVPQIQVV